MTTNPPGQSLAEIILQVIKEQKPETVSQLARIVSDKLPNASEEEILNSIAQLQSEDKLRVSPQPLTSQKLSAYIRTGQTLWFWMTLVCTLASMGAVFLIPPDSGPIVIVRNVLGTLFILWFPGYTLIKVLFPTSTRSTRTSEKDIDIVERVAMSLGLSIALVPIVGLLLNYTPWGITLTPIVLSLTVLTLLLATVALIRENQTRNKARYTHELKDEFPRI